MGARRMRVRANAAAQAGAARTRRRLASEHGQMTVELAVVLPVALVIALVAVNALLFFSECAAFDRAARNAVRVYTTSPVAGQTVEQSAAAVENALAAGDGDAFVESSVAVSKDALGHATFEMTLRFYPTLFGLPFNREVFGVSLPPLVHTTRIVVDAYKPGMLF